MPTDSTLLVLVSRPEIPWPLAIAERAMAIWLPDELIADGQADPRPHWLGYASAIDSVNAVGDWRDAATLRSFLEDWRRDSERLLSLWRNDPKRFRLLNLARLTPEAVQRLLDGDSDAAAETGDSHQRERARTSADAPGEEALEARILEAEVLEAGLLAAAPNPLIPELPGRQQALATSDPRLACYLERREDLHELYAELESCADLLGREPEYQAGADRVDPEAAAELLLQAWEGRQLAARQEAELAELQQNHQALQTRLSRREAELVRRALAIEEDLSNSVELLELQLQQVQQELRIVEQERCQSLARQQEQSQQLERLLPMEQALRQSQAREQERSQQQQRLTLLEQENQRLFLALGGGDCLERSQIPLTVELMRRRLQLNGSASS